MAMAAHARRADFAVLKAAGGTRGQLLSVALGETTLVVVLGAALGLLVTLPSLAGMASGLSQATATDVGLQLSWGILVGATLECLSLALLASLVVTWRTTRPRAA